MDLDQPAPYSDHTNGINAPRNARGQFAPGHPGFKPQGARHRATRMLAEICSDNARDVMLAMVEKAKAGDTTAAKLVLERVCPPLREPLREPIEVDLHTEGGALAALQALAQRAAEGTLPAGKPKTSPCCSAQ
jgi:hypothetical protein